MNFFPKTNIKSNLDIRLAGAAVAELNALNVEKAAKEEKKKGKYSMQIRYFIINFMYILIHY